MNLDHLINAEDTTPIDLGQVKEAASAYVALKSNVKDLEEQLKAEKKRMLKVEQEVLPEALLSLGLSSIQLDTGETISVKADVKASVKDMERMVEFLDERGDSAIVKTNMELGKIPPEILQKIADFMSENYDIYPDINQKIHASTLAKYVREMCGIGDATEQGRANATAQLSEIDQTMLSTYLYYKVAVK